MADPTPSLQDQMMEELVSVTAENTTTLIDVQKQAASTAASVKDARTYIARVASNTDWEANGEKIAATLSAALQKDHTALHAAAEAARDMQVVSRDLTHKISSAAQAQREGSKEFHQAATRLLGVMEAHREGRLAQNGRYGPHSGSLWRSGLLCAGTDKQICPPPGGRDRA